MGASSQSQEENKENRGSVEFQVVSFANKIRRLTSHLELHKKDYLSQRALTTKFGMDWCGSSTPRTPEYRTMNEERHEIK
ncbi:hypothetical protein E3N88_13317 [Mikania micrantha]|uniref:Small ribosomal subunit protein uS15c n=1 Tax=Mikania micrantha TaxID=192012 RepID=A0A5N6P997_9ASTR|nr:hypothetical protein E3N88_13317 [Mikania micrantha]